MPEPFQVEKKKESYQAQINIKLSNEELQLIDDEADALDYSRPSFVKFCVGEYFRNKDRY